MKWARRGRLLLFIPIVVLLSADSWVLLNRTRVTPVTLEDALSQFRQDAPVDPVRESSEAPAAPAQGGYSESTKIAGGATPATQGGPAPSESDADPVDSSAPYTPAAYKRPAAGVYTYDTEGYETLASGGARHDFPDTTQAIVRDIEGCNWRFDHVVIEEHADTYDQCSSAGESSWYRWRLERTFLGQTVVYDFRCPGDSAMLKPGRGPGAEWTLECDTEDGGTHATDRFRHMGDEPMRIGGDDVTAAHIHVDITNTGEVEGTLDIDLWLDPRTGLRLREERVIDTRAPTPIGPKTDYYEEATFQLRSLTPAT